MKEEGGREGRKMEMVGRKEEGRRVKENRDGRNEGRRKKGKEGREEG